MVINDKSLMQDCLVELGHHTRAKEADPEPWFLSGSSPNKQRLPDQRIFKHLCDLMHGDKTTLDHDTLKDMLISCSWKTRTRSGTVALKWVQCCLYLRTVKM